MEKAVLVGPCVGEMYWELARFASHVIWKKKNKYKDKKLIVFTRPDRFDMYGKYADILVPMRIKGDGIRYVADCFRLKGFKEKNELIKQFRDKYEKRFKIIEHIYPNCSGKNWSSKNQYPPNQMLFNEFKPREDNVKIIDRIPDDKPWVVLAPRFRKGLRRNWPHWEKFYDLLSNSELNEKYYFVLCGKLPDHVPDPKSRFFDINDFDMTENTSLIGLTLEVLRRAHFTIGSQSGIPNISLLYGVEVLEWGHQKSLHTRTYNVFNTKITFIDDGKYNVEPKIVLKRLKKCLGEKENEQEKRKPMAVAV